MLKKVSGIFLSSLVLVSSFGFDAKSESDQRKAIVQNLVKQVQIKVGSGAWRNASASQQLSPGSQIRTGAASKVDLLYPDGTLTRLGSRTTLSVLDRSNRAVKLDKGKVWFKVAKKSAGYKIYSPTAMAAITGTEGFFDFDDKSGDKDEQEASSVIRIASSDKNFRIAADAPVISAGLVEGSMDMFKGADDKGNPIGGSSSIKEGQIFNMIGSNINIQNPGIGSILKQYGDISSNSGGNGNNNNNNNNNNNKKDEPKKDEPKADNKPAPKSVSDEKLGQSNVTTEKQPNLPNKNQNVNTSPTTGTLEIIIK